MKLIRNDARITVLALTITIGLALLSACSREPENPADAVYYGGDILTLAGDQPQYVEALAVDDGKISFVGSKIEADKLVGKATQQVDLLGATLIPSVVSGVQQDLTLQGATSEPNCWKDAAFKSSEDVIAALKIAQAERAKVVPGLLCFGYSPSLANAPVLTEADLDLAFPDTSVILVEASMQRVLANSVAKKKFSLDAYKTLKNAIRKTGVQGAGLNVGQSADFMLLDKNPLKDASLSLASIRITQSFVQGKPVLDAPKDLAMLAILDIFAAVAEEKAAAMKLDEMNAAAAASKAADFAKAAEKKAADAKAKMKAQAGLKANARTDSKAKSDAEVKQAAKRTNTKTEIVRKPESVETPIAAEPSKPKEVRFNMTQNGKKMTPEDFDAWMKAQGIRIVPAKPVEASPSLEKK